MSTKEPLSIKRINKLIKALEDCDVEQDHDVVFDEKTTFITVNDYGGDEVTVSYDFYGDDARRSAPTPTIHYTIKVCKLTFTATQEYGEIDEWVLESDKYFIPEEYWDEVQDLLNDVVEELDPYDVDLYPTELYEEWSRDEVIEEIESKLEYEDYIEIDDRIFSLEDTVQDFIDNYNSMHDTNFVLDGDGYTLLSRREVAERLTEKIY